MNIEGLFERPKDKRVEKLESLRALWETPDFDQALYPVLERFANLPFTTVESCSGHIFVENGQEVLDESRQPHLCIVEDRNPSTQEAETQQAFLENISHLNSILIEMLGNSEIQAIIGGYLEEIDIANEREYPFKQLTLEETLEKGYPYTLQFKVGRSESYLPHEVLVKVWQGFFKYLEQFDGKDLPLPEFRRELFFKRA